MEELAEEDTGAVLNECHVAIEAWIDAFDDRDAESDCSDGSDTSDLSLELSDSIKEALESGELRGWAA